MTDPANSKHQTLVDLVGDILESQGKDVDRNLVYRKGELDILCEGIYYEVKSNYSSGNARKAYKQITRAIENGMCHYGFMVTYQGVYDVLDDPDKQVPFPENLMWGLK